MPYTTVSDVRSILEESGLLASCAAGDEGLWERAVEGCSFDSRNAGAGDLFFCKGAAFRTAFLESALDAGAVCFVAEASLEPELAPLAAGRGVVGLFVGDVRLAMAAVPPAVYGYPDEDLSVVGITGTKGKSSTAYMLRAILDAAGDGSPQTGIIGSIDTFDGIIDEESHNTTPEAPAVWKHLANARASHLSSMVMEVSSQALKYDRTLGLTFDVACFLNIGLDHISDQEHTDFEDYFSSKLLIFEQCLDAVVNLDSDHADRILAAAREGAPNVVTFGIGRDDADVSASDLETVDGEVWFTVRARTFERRMHLPFPGDFNVSNALAAVASAELLGVSPDAMEQGLADVVVPGRMEFFRSRDRKLVALVDYAHNKLSFEAVFSAVRRDFPEFRVIALFGAAGGKALERRVELPQVAAKYADHIVVANEDPWTEDPLSICLEIESNLPAGFPHDVIPDRERAIARCFEVAGDGPAVVMLLAKGRETYMHMADGFDPMTPDTELARRHIAAYDASHPA